MRNFENQFMKLSGIVLWGIIALIGLFSSFFVVESKEIGLISRFGSIQNQTYWAGLHFKIPFADSVIVYSVQNIKSSIQTQGASKDLQNVDASLAINYAIIPTKAKEVYTTLGTLRDVENKIIEPSVHETLKSVVSQFNAEELISKRAEVSLKIQEQLQKKIEKYGVKMMDANIVNFQFSKSFADAIENKVTIEQEALSEKNKLEKVKYEAEQKIVAAKAEAEQIRIQAEAIQKQGGKEYVKLKFIEKWNGELPTTIMGEGVNAILDLKDAK